MEGSGAARRVRRVKDESEAVKSSEGEIVAQRHEIVNTLSR